MDSAALSSIADDCHQPDRLAGSGTGAASGPSQCGYGVGVDRPCAASAHFQHVTDRLLTGISAGHGCMISNPPCSWAIPPEYRVMAKRPPNDGASWSARELKTLKALAKSGTATWP